MASLPSYKINFTDPLNGSFIVAAFGTDGSIFPTINLPLDPSAINANSSILLYGKGSPNYGERTAEDLLHTLESFYGATEPAHAVSGQLWFATVHYWFDPGSVVPGFSGWYRFDDFTQTWMQVTDTELPPSSNTPFDPVGAPPAGILYHFNTVTQTFFAWNTNPEFPVWQPRLYINPVPPAAPSNGIDFPEKQLLVCHNKSVPTPGQVGASFSSKWRRSLSIPNTINPPASPQVGDLWFDTSVPQLRVWDGSAWVSVADRYVLKSGDTMTGFLFLSANPLLPTHAATKSYVDTRVFRTGDTMTGPLILFGPPSAALEAVPLNFLVSSNITNNSIVAGATVTNALDTLDTDKVDLAGDMMTGFLFLSADPILPAHAATKNYVDITAAALGADGTILSVDTTSFPGNLTIFMTAAHAGVNPFITPLSAVNIPFAPTGSISSTDVQAAIAELGVEKAPSDNPSFTTGVTLLFPATVLLSRDPVVGLEAATKQYVDAGGSPSIQRRRITSTGASTYSIITPTPPDPLTAYVVGSNQVWIFVNGVKQVIGDRGYQDVEFSPTVTPSTDTTLALPIVSVVAGGAGTGSFTVANDFSTRYVTGYVFVVSGSTGNDGTYTVMAPGSVFGVGITTIPVVEAVPSAVADGFVTNTYTATIAVDGGAPQLISVSGLAATTFSSLITEIDTDLTGAEPFLLSDGSAIRVISDSTGVTSTILITDGVAAPLFGSLFAFMTIAAAVPGVNGAYQEDGVFGASSISITFTPAVPVSDTIEFMKFGA